MFRSASTHQRRWKRLGAITLLALAVSGISTQAAMALTGNEVETIYFSNASKTTVVGERHLFCSGQVYKWGTTSPYYTRYSTPCY